MMIKYPACVKYLLSFLLLLGGTALSAQETLVRNEVRYDSYKMAQSASEKISFTIKSTKFGMVTTSVEGFALGYRSSGSIDWNNSKAKDLKIDMQVRSLNTDNESRDEKMWDHCFNSKEFPELSVRIQEALPFPLEQREVSGEIWIRGKSFPLKVNLALTKTAEGLHATGTATMSFKQYEIPDPSILIASVDDNIQIKFEIDLKK